LLWSVQGKTGGLCAYIRLAEKKYGGKEGEGKQERHLTERAFPRPLEKKKKKKKNGVEERGGKRSD